MSPTYPGGTLLKLAHLFYTHDINERKTAMKKVCMLAFALALAVALPASAQNLVDFTNLSPIPTPTAIPASYAGLTWTTISYVDALTYPDVGPGFTTGPEVMVAFGGGPLCFPAYGGTRNNGAPFKHICDATIEVGPGSPTAVFQLNAMTVAAGWHATGDFITLSAYNNGVQVGTDTRFNLTTASQRFVLPAWGPITQLVIHPNPMGSFVFYVLEFQ
jgi:hypothetical protein